MGVDAARALVPDWVLPAAAAAHACAAFLPTFALCAGLFARSRRADALKAPWPLRARALYPSRATLLLASFVLPASLLVTVPRSRGDLLGDEVPVALSAAAGSAAAAVFWRRRLSRLLVGSAWTFRRALLGVATRTLVMYPHLWALAAAAIAMPRRFGPAAAALLAAATVAVLLLARGGGFRIARALGLAPPAPPEVADDLHAAAARAGIPLAGVHVLELPEANAYALPFAGRIGFTRSALRKLERRSILAIGHHEIAHLAEPSRARLARSAATLALVPLLLARPLAATGGLAAVLLAVVAALLLGRILGRTLRALETRADEGAKEAAPEGHVYAEALAELYRLNLVPAVSRATTHPHLYDRLVALGAPPPYPRPPPPSRAKLLGLYGVVVVLAVALALSGSIAAAFADGHPWVAVALDGGSARDAGDLARCLHASGRFDEAATFYAAAAELEPDRPHWPAYRSMSLAALGRVDDAVAAFLDADERARRWPGACADVLAAAQGCIERARRR